MYMLSCPMGVCNGVKFGANFADLGILVLMFDGTVAAMEESFDFTEDEEDVDLKADRNEKRRLAGTSFTTSASRHGVTSAVAVETLFGFNADVIVAEEEELEDEGSAVDPSPE